MPIDADAISPAFVTGSTVASAEEDKLGPECFLFGSAGLFGLFRSTLTVALSGGSGKPARRNASSCTVMSLCKSHAGAAVATEILRVLSMLADWRQWQYSPIYSKVDKVLSAMRQLAGYRINEGQAEMRMPCIMV